MQSEPPTLFQTLVYAPVPRPAAQVNAQVGSRSAAARIDPLQISSILFFLVVLIVAAWLMTQGAGEFNATLDALNGVGLYYFPLVWFPIVMWFGYRVKKRRRILTHGDVVWGRVTRPWKGGVHITAALRDGRHQDIKVGIRSLALAPRVGEVVAVFMLPRDRDAFVLWSPDRGAPARRPAM